MKMTATSTPQWAPTERLQLRMTQQTTKRHTARDGDVRAEEYICDISSLQL